jgi:hypothetical protein
MVALMSVFETATMAELCVKQGIVEEAIGIYRRLAAEATDAESRNRYTTRLVELENRVAPLPLQPPGLRLARRGDEVEIEWQLPADVRAPALQVLILRRTPQGIGTEPRTIPLTSPHGQTVIAAQNLYAVRAAAGRLDGDTFIPIARIA